MSDNRRMTFGFFWVSKAEGHACQIKALMANSLNRCTLQFLREPHHSHSMPTDDRLPTRERASSDPDFYVVLRMKGAAFSWEKTAWPVEIREDDMAPIYKILTIFFILCTTSDFTVSKMVNKTKSKRRIHNEIRVKWFHSYFIPLPTKYSFGCFMLNIGLQFETSTSFREFFITVCFCFWPFP